MEWKNISKDYLISDRGEVYSLFRHRKLFPSPTKGYLHVNLKICGVTKRCSVHRLVAQAFIPNPMNYPEINHMDGDKLNNRVENLEWCTSEMNNAHAMAAGLNLYGEKVLHSKMTGYGVFQARLMYATTSIGFKRLAKLYGVDRNVIREIINGKAWRHI